MTNWRLENEQTSGAHAGRTLKCVVHGWHYEATSVCAHCAPPDPPAPEVGMPVLICGGLGRVSAQRIAGIVIAGSNGHLAIHAPTTGRFYTIGTWLVDTFPDFATPWAKSWNQTTLSVPVGGTVVMCGGGGGGGGGGGFTVADVEEAVATLKKGVVALEAANATPCHVCGKSNEYAHLANTSKGWRCTECRIIAGML